MAGLIIDARKNGFILVGLVLLHLVMISHQVDGGSGASLLQRMVFVVLSPVQEAVAAAVRGVARAWSGYVDLRGVREKNDRLEERLSILETLLQEKQYKAREAERLRELLGLRELLPHKTIVAEVVAREGMPWFRSITIDKGREAGVALEAPVLSPTGVVGRVIWVGPRSARVQLLQDRDSGAGVLIERSRVKGVVAGQVGFAESSSGDLVMKYVPELADVVVGDVVVTSGQDRIYPKGLVVGRVRFVSPGYLSKEVLVEPSARFEQLEEVLVVRGSQEEPLPSEAVR
ncbi:MAG TPA: rod shape-determining protein MreC [Vicinamibacteria bacterium]|nr:rod shape-determining protein MreC [Vicinamibacteria bacterium]